MTKTAWTAQGECVSEKTRKIQIKRDSAVTLTNKRIQEAAARTLLRVLPSLEKKELTFKSCSCHPLLESCSEE